MALWFLGYPTSALERSHGGLALARELADTGSIANALPFAAIVHQLRGDLEATWEVTESLIALSIEGGFQQWLAFGRVFESWVHAKRGRGDEPFTRLRRDIEAYRATQSEFYVQCFLVLLATAQLQGGEASAGLDTVAAALGMADATGVLLWDPEFLRLRGELLLARDPAAAPDAEAAFRQALALARRHLAKSWELQAATSLARLLARQGKRDEARALVGAVYGWFTEGFDTVPLREAKALLDELG
ncbi:MAG TPA: hypothetical protein VGD07_02095, partial [Methylomirabilota bacterium]